MGRFRFRVRINTFIRDSLWPAVAVFNCFVFGPKKLNLAELSLCVMLPVFLVLKWYTLNATTFSIDSEYCAGRSSDPFGSTLNLFANQRPIMS